MIEIAPATIADVTEILPLARDEQIETIRHEMPNWVSGRAPIGPQITRCARLDGVPIAIWGVYPPALGVRDIPVAWALFSKQARGYGLSLLKASRKHLEDVVHGALGYDIVAGTYDPSDREARRWLEANYFRKVGVLEKYGPNDESYILTARVWE
jgi:hypothetical protein